MPFKLRSETVPGLRSEITTYYGPNGGVVTKDTATGPMLDFNLNKSWSNTPAFSSVRASGRPLPDNPYSLESITVKGGGGGSGQAFEGGFYQIHYMGHHSATYSPHDAPQSMDVNDLNGKLIQKMKSNQWNAPIFFAEAGKTANMVVQRATHLARLANHLRRGNLPLFCSELKTAVFPSQGRQKKFLSDYGKRPRAAAGNAWLEYQYGWKPFMKDVQDATNTLMDLAEQPQRMRGTATARAKYESKTESRQLLFNDGTYADAGRLVIVRNASTRAKWHFTPNSLDMPARLGLLNPLEVAWELVPFSFVADWFLPIGSYLAALDVPMRVSHSGGTYGLRKETITETYPDRMKPGIGTILSLTRTPMQGLPTIGLTFSSGLNSGARVASAISLLNQQLGGFRR